LQSERVKRYSPVSKLSAEADVLVATAGHNGDVDNGETLLFLSGSKTMSSGYSSINWFKNYFNISSKIMQKHLTF